MKILLQKKLFALALGAVLMSSALVARAQHMSHYMASKSAPAARYRNVRGRVVSISRRSSPPTIELAHERIPGFMNAMTMTLPLHNSRDAMRLKTGAKIRCDLLKVGGTYHATNIHNLSRATRLKLAR